MTQGNTIFQGFILFSNFFQDWLWDMRLTWLHGQEVEPGPGNRPCLPYSKWSSVGWLVSVASWTDSQRGNKRSCCYHSLMSPAGGIVICSPWLNQGVTILVNSVLGNTVKQFGPGSHTTSLPLDSSVKKLSAAKCGGTNVWYQHCGTLTQGGLQVWTQPGKLSESLF